ncbi:hypothetical protein GDO81_020929 [Engystomops pustulosus]|uniref:RNA-binding protein 6 n=1 Tax=Engystomops pustulosus TaxID=76066 RepID=A0AAV6Z0A5_ENGPU|nr:hypothetical protein GDO81_020929 [Engystomops pustulosus]KAG8539427.1 hypothetical protein GDO81_020929 [Engystomops pustulosus]KAG8539428.1 hypothetical protein GDO81_020929 [Engystomops pustulosus]
MWDTPRQPPPGFRGEAFTPRIPPGPHPRMRGRPPFPFRDGPRGSNPHFSGPGVAPFMHRDMTIDRHWEQEQLHPSRRPRLNMNYRALEPDMDYREREASIMAARGMPDVDYRHEGAAIAYRERLPPPLIFRERESLEYRRRMLAEMELREREALEQQRQRISSMPDFSQREMEELEYKRRLDALQDIVLRQRESSDLVFRDRGGGDMMQRERSPLDRGLPAHVRESADLDLRFRKPDMNFMDQEKELDYRERMVIGYSHNDTETKGPGPKYMEGANLKETAANKKEVEIPGINSDTDYREKESVDLDYREKETSDSDYRDNTDSDYRDIEAIDSDYWGKESADSDYRERESADTDYRKSEDGTKKSADTKKMPAGGAKMETKEKELKRSMAAPAPVPPGAEQRIPFLPYEEPPIPPPSKMNNKAPVQEGPLSTAKGESDKCAYPGKLDVDFRDQPKPEDLNLDTKEAPSKVLAYPMDIKEPRPGDQDMRSKDMAQAGGDQDFRMGKYLQKKDEDFRGGKEQTSVDILSQSSLLYDFLKLAAKELKQQEKGGARAVAGAHTPEKPAKAKTPHPAPSSKLAAVGQSTGVEFMGRRDTDYRNQEYNDVDLRVARGPDRKSHDDLQPGSKDKDYRRTTIPDGATRIIWLDGLPTGASREEILSALSGAHPLPDDGVNLIGYIPGGCPCE